MAVLGEVHRFPTAKKLVGYLGLSPRKQQSGNNSRGREQGMGHTGRGDVRAMLIQSSQNALNQKNSPLHKWGWRLTLRKNRNQAVAAVARKLAVSIWHLLMVHSTPLVEAGEHLRDKLAKLATVLGKHWLIAAIQNIKILLNQRPNPRNGACGASPASYITLIASLQRHLSECLNILKQLLPPLELSYLVYQNVPTTRS